MLQPPNPFQCQTLQEVLLVLILVSTQLSQVLKTEPVQSLHIQILQAYFQALSEIWIFSPIVSCRRFRTIPLAVGVIGYERTLPRTRSQVPHEKP